MKIYKIIPVLFLLFVHNVGLLADDDLFKKPEVSPTEYLGTITDGNTHNTPDNTKCTWDYSTNFTYSATQVGNNNIATKAYIYYYGDDNTMEWKEVNESNTLVEDKKLDLEGQDNTPYVKLNAKKLKSSSKVYILFVSYVKDGVNQIINPGFEDTWNPNGIPSSQYDWKEPGNNGLEGVQGTYTIDNTIDRNNTTSTGCSQDHTSINGGTGGMFFMANGHSNKEKFVWVQSFETSPKLSANEYYAFSAWAMNWAGDGHGNPPQLQFYINNKSDENKLGDRMDVKGGDQCIWKQISAIKKMSSETSITQLSLLNEETESSGNDFGLDDLYFGKVKKVYQLYTIDIGKYFEPEVISVALCPTLLTNKTIDGVKDYIVSKLSGIISGINKADLHIEGKEDNEVISDGTLVFNYEITDTGTNCQYISKIIKVTYKETPEKTWKDRGTNP